MRLVQRAKKTLLGAMKVIVKASLSVGMPFRGQLTDEQDFLSICGE
jgi:hypothetical protein